MTWKTVANNHFGSVHKFGGNDIDKISKYFGGIEDVDTVDINTNWPIRDDKFKLRNPANTASYIYSTSAIPSDITITEPVMSFTSDRPVYENATQILSNKTFAASSPLPNEVTVTGIDSDLIGDPTNKRWGTWYPAPTGTTPSTVGKFEGILSGYTPTAPVANVAHHATAGLVMSFARASADGGDVFLQSPSTIGQFRLAKAGRFNVKAYSAVGSGGHFTVGLKSVAAYNGGVVDAPDAVAFILGWDGNGGEHLFYTKNDSASNVTQQKFSAPFNNVIVPHSYEMSWGPSGVSATVDGGTLTATTNLPNPNTDLFFQLGQSGSHPTANPLIALTKVYIESQ